MGTKIYVSNLPYTATSGDLKRYLSEQGYHPSDVDVVVSPEDGRSRGFGFATLGSEDELARALAELPDEDFMGRPLRVAVAVDKKRNGGARGRGNRREARGRGADHRDGRPGRGAPRPLSWEDF